MNKIVAKILEDKRFLAFLFLLTLFSFLKTATILLTYRYNSDTITIFNALKGVFTPQGSTYSSIIIESIKHAPFHLFNFGLCNLIGIDIIFLDLLYMFLMNIVLGFSLFLLLFHYINNKMLSYILVLFFIMFNPFKILYYGYGFMPGQSTNWGFIMMSVIPLSIFLVITRRQVLSTILNIIIILFHPPQGLVLAFSHLSYTILKNRRIKKEVFLIGLSYLFPVVILKLVLSGHAGGACDFTKYNIFIHMRNVGHMLPWLEGSQNICLFICLTIFLVFILLKSFSKENLSLFKEDLIIFLIISTFLILVPIFSYYIYFHPIILSLILSRVSLLLFFFIFLIFSYILSINYSKEKDLLKFFSYLIVALITYQINRLLPTVLIIPLLFSINANNLRHKIIYLSFISLTIVTLMVWNYDSFKTPYSFKIKLALSCISIILLVFPILKLKFYFKYKYFYKIGIVFLMVFFISFFIARKVRWVRKYRKEALELQQIYKTIESDTQKNDSILIVSADKSPLKYISYSMNRTNLVNPILITMPTYLYSTLDRNEKEVFLLYNFKFDNSSLQLVQQNGLEHVISNAVSMYTPQKLSELQAQYPSFNHIVTPSGFKFNQNLPIKVIYENNIGKIYKIIRESTPK